MSLGCPIHPPTAPRSPKCSKCALSLLRVPHDPVGALIRSGITPSRSCLRAPHTRRAPHPKWGGGGGEPSIHPWGACVLKYSHNISIYPQDNPYPPIQPQLPPIQLHPQNALYVFYAPPGNPCAPLEPQYAP